MQLSDAFVDRLIRRLIDDHIVSDYASEYGEPGYSFSGDGSTERFLIGDWWCKCGRFHRYPDGRLERHRQYDRDDHGPPNPKRLHDVMSHHPRLWRQLESQGVEWAFYDEWMVDYETGKAYRTTGDSYHWQPSVVLNDVGEWLTPDTDIEAWIAWARNDPRRCLFDRQRRDLEAAGFENVNGIFENGWHPGQTDDPTTILSAYQERDDDPDAEYVFAIDENSQFYTTFVLYRRGDPVDTPRCDECGITDEEAGQDWCGVCGMCHDHCEDRDAHEAEAEWMAGLREHSPRLTALLTTPTVFDVQEDA